MSVSIARAVRSLPALLAAVLVAAPAPGQAPPSGVRWDKKIGVASGSGVKGPWRMNRSAFHYVDDPTAAIDDKGVVGVAWADQTRHDIFLQIYEPDGKERLAKPVNVSRSPDTFSWLPRMVIADRGDVYIVWQEIVFSGGSHGGEIFFARSTDGGKTFSSPANLSNSIAGDGKGRLTRRYWDNGSLDLAIGPAGGLYAAWTEYDGNLWFGRSTDRGRTFTKPVLVAGGGDTKPARGPALAVGAAGTVYLAWTVGEDRTADIRIAVSADKGRSFAGPRIVAKSGGHADAPKIAVDGEGTIHLVYAESPAGPFDRYHIRYARSKDGAAAFDEPREISGPHTARFESVSFPSLALDGAGNIYVLWEIFPNRKGYSQGLGFTYSGDAGRTFASPSIVPDTIVPALGVNGSQQGMLMRKLAVNRSAMVAVVNSTFKLNRSSHIWLLRGKADLR